jgi:DMSO/TMAO reductase YedYZ molybdopterin-dependent catalytic subunit
MSILDKAESLTRTVQHALLAPRAALAPEYPPGAISSTFKPNGSVDPDDADYVAARKASFADWKLEVGGLVERPMSLSLAHAHRSPAMTASRAGAASASGRAPSSPRCSAPRA